MAPRSRRNQKPWRRRCKVFGAAAENESMKYFFDYKLAERYGYGMAVYIAAEMSDWQRAIDLTNARRLRAGRRLIEDARIEDVLSALRNTGRLSTETDEGGANVPDAAR
ncbi:hypothetical protein [Paraburkholderia aromaticivorans]|nr:hypothetical protein [Paraburkholderia aromaticivorans]